MKDKLKILITIECYPPVITGSGITTMRIATGLAKRGHQVLVVCPGKSIKPKINVESGVTVHRVRSLPVPKISHQNFSFSAFPRNYIKHIFKEFKPNIVHIADHFFISSAAVSLAKKNKIKVVGTNYFTPYNAIDNLMIKKNSLLYRILEKILWHYFLNIFNNIDVVTTPTATAKKIIQNVGLKKSISVISCGLDIEKFKKNEPGNEIFFKYKIQTNKIIFLSASRLDREKRVDVLLEALSMIKDKIDFQFIITGRGIDKENLEKITLKKNLTDRVVFTDFVSVSELKSLYSISDIFLTASEVELQGLSIMEAMACGLPVIAASSMAIPELVKDGINGFLFEPVNVVDASKKILLLASDKKLREKMSLNSLRLIREHDLDATLAKFEEIYYECVYEVAKTYEY
ncbi:MAG: glycosyltransferase [Actinobacteria bacterium]|nr:glycosyltransferase [Actinomycetota bacterium]